MLERDLIQSKRRSMQVKLHGPNQFYAYRGQGHLIRSTIWAARVGEDVGKLEGKHAYKNRL